VNGRISSRENGGSQWAIPGAGGARRVDGDAVMKKNCASVDKKEKSEIIPSAIIVANPKSLYTQRVKFRQFARRAEVDFESQVAHYAIRTD
jgi:hypothetical protein